MYKIFKLPQNFLHHTYTQEEKDSYDNAIMDYYNGNAVPLAEALDDKQKRKVDGMWGPDHIARNAHAPVFGNEDRITIPYDDSNDEKITSDNAHRVPTIRGVDNNDIRHRKILAHLKSNGYHVDDYATGLTHHVDTPTRKIKIVAAMKKIGSDQQPSGFFTKGKHGKTKTEMTMAQAYESDPVRAAVTKEKHVIITKNKYDVAGMSTDRGWKSCMNLVDGQNKHYVRHDIQHGTLTAYLCTTADNNISHPIGRINLKKFMHVSSNHAVYRPENSQYGTVPSKMHDVVNEWAEKNYPIKDAGIYAKASSLYNDDGVDIKAHNLHELDPEKELHRTTENLLTHKLRKIKDYFDGNQKEDDGFDSISFTAQNTLDEHHNNLSNKQEAHSVLHWVADHSSENRGDHPKDMDDLDYDDIDSNTPLHSWACDNTRKFRNNVKEFSPTDAMIGLDKIHNAIRGDEDEQHEHLKSIHGDLIDHVFKQNGPEWDHVKSHIVDHMTEDKHSDYYFNNRRSNVTDESDRLSGYPLATLSHNPRQIHKLLDYENDHLEENSLDHAKAIHHIGKHADLKLAHHVYLENDNMPPDHVGSFTRALNENPNGEHVQHELLNQMHLYAGDDDDYSARHESMINSIAKHTTHKSVVDRIKARTNADLSFAKTAIKSNSLYTHSPVMEAYLRFLK